VAEQGLRQSRTANGVLFHETRRIRDSAPLAIVVGVFALVALIFTVVALAIALREPPPAANAWLLLAVFVGFPWLALYTLQRRSVEIILTSGRLSVRKGIVRWRHIPIQDIALVRADTYHLPKPDVYVGGIGASGSSGVNLWKRERQFYVGVELTVVTRKGRRLRVKSVEPKTLLPAMDRLLDESVERKGKAWGKHGIAKPN